MSATTTAPYNLANYVKFGHKCMVLLSAASLGKVFNVGILTERCFEKYPRHFSLNGRIDSYPDSRKVVTYLYGRVGLVTQNHFNNVHGNEYTITHQGWEYVEALATEDSARIKEAAKPWPSHADGAIYHIITTTKAYQLWNNGNANRITYKDAIDCITAIVKHVKVEDRLHNTIRLLLETVEEEPVIWKGMRLQERDIRLLLFFYSSLVEQFPELMKLRWKYGERVQSSCKESKAS